MNCYYHPEKSAIATCLDCGKGLCDVCGKLYSMPICNECNMTRSKNEKKLIINQYIPSVIGLILGVLFGILQFKNVLPALVFGYLFAGIPWGWKVITFIQPKMFLFLSYTGWAIYFLIKTVLAYFIGIIAMPVGIVRLILKHKSANEKKQNIINNTNQQ